MERAGLFISEVDVRRRSVCVLLFFILLIVESYNLMGSRGFKKERHFTFCYQRIR